MASERDGGAWRHVTAWCGGNRSCRTNGFCPVRDLKDQICARLSSTR
ncbi:hypothetical protein HanXRQr2_Chr15g0718031 [Helianthus annuus]|uniref:Uncharacterized protein n=1 Tax=Helianthus annuus TaxID=4232 RepID=A0A9K3H5B9_HELAN|nr:hypothetical protein HanXRQr2_Chr15g0718031 [Helianthus annuus]